MLRSGNAGLLDVGRHMHLDVFDLTNALPLGQQRNEESANGANETDGEVWHLHTSRHSQKFNNLLLLRQPMEVTLSRTGASEYYGTGARHRITLCSRDGAFQSENVERVCATHAWHWSITRTAQGYGIVGNGRARIVSGPAPFGRADARLVEGPTYPLLFEPLLQRSRALRFKSWCYRRPAGAFSGFGVRRPPAAA
jgi:hypothetical protein